MINEIWNEPIPYKDLPKDPKIRVYDFDPMNSFTKKFLHIYDKTESWVEYTLFTVIVKTYDGDIYLYDDLNNKLIPITLFDDSRKLTELEWRGSFAYFLNRKITSSCMNKYDIANEVGISNVQLSRYLNLKATPSGYIIQKLANVLECDINDIMPHDLAPIID